MRKLIAIMCAGVLALSLVGCSQQQEPAEQQEPAQAEPEPEPEKTPEEELQEKIDQYEEYGERLSDSNCFTLDDMIGVFVDYLDNGEYDKAIATTEEMTSICEDVTGPGYVPSFLISADEDIKQAAYCYSSAASELRFAARKMKDGEVGDASDALDRAADAIRDGEEKLGVAIDKLGEIQDDLNAQKNALGLS